MSNVKTHDVLIVNKSVAVQPGLREDEVVITNTLTGSKIRISPEFYIEAVGVSAPEQYRSNAVMTWETWRILEESSPNGVER